MKKLILATTLSVFATFGLVSLGAPAALACDGMKDHAKGDKSDQGGQTNSTAKKDGKSGTKTDQKS